MHGKPIRETVETLTRLYPRAAMLGGLVAACLLSAVVTSATPIDARVIYSFGDRAYLVARDSAWVTMGSSLRFFEKKKEVASGVVLAIEDSTLIIARIASGSLGRVKNLDRIRVEGERAPSPKGTALRVGYPSSTRIQPFFECRRMTLDPHGYRADTLSTRSYRLFRASSGTANPDTLLVRLFDDAADEEIALERGELDAAVFWPGEASAHIREAMRWQGIPNVLRTRGVIANYENPGLRALPDMYEADQTRVDSVNTEMFRGDLKPASHIRFVSEHPMMPSRFEVDSACPGKRSMEAFLNRGRAPGRGILRFVTYLDEPTDPNLVEESRGRLFLMSCPVLSRPELRPYLDSIDLSAIVNLFDCETAARKP